MRKALSLIELIFTIVIIAVVFTVIPKIVFALNKSDSFAIKQDALFNGVTLMQMISKLNWDENSSATNDVLSTGSNAFFECNATTHYRKGGFVGSRNCKENSGLSPASLSTNFGKMDASDSIGLDWQPDDIDDFNAYDKNSTIENNVSKFLYGLHVDVSYLQESAAVFDYATTPRVVIIDLNQSATQTSPSTNLKKVDVSITYQGKRAEEKGQSIARFSYVSSNIGKVFLNKRTW